MHNLYLTSTRTQQDEIAKGLRILNSIAKKIRKARVERGALELASTEIKFKIEQQTKDPTGIGILFWYSSD